MSLEGGGSSGTSSGAIEAGKAFVSIGTNDDLLTKGLKSAGAAVASWAKSVSSAFTSVTGYFTGAFDQLYGRVEKSINRSNDIFNLADRLDATTESVSGLGYAFELLGQDVTTLEPIFKHINNAALESIRDVNGQQAAIFELMNTSAEDFLAMDLHQKIILMSEAYNSLETQIEKTAFVTGLAGKSAGQLVAILKQGPEGIQGMLDESARLGRTVSTESAKNANEAKKNLIAMGYAVAGIFNAFTKPLVEVMGKTKDFSNFVQVCALALKDLLSTLSPAAVAIFILGAAFTAVGTAAGIAVAIISVGFGALLGIVTSVASLIWVVVSGVISVLSSPVGIILSIFAALVVSSSHFATSVGAVFDAIKQGGNTLVAGFASLAGIVEDTYKGISMAMSKNDLKLANEILVNGLTVTWLQLKHTVLSVFEDIYLGFARLMASIEKVAKTGLSSAAKPLVNAGIGAAQFVMGDVLGRDKERQQWFNDLRKELLADVDREIERHQRKAGEVDKMGDAQLQDWLARDQEIRALKVRMKKAFSKADDIVFDMQGGPDATSKMNETVANTLGDAVRGVFHSSDFAGRLGYGPASNYAKESVKVQKDILGVAKEIRDKVAAPAFK